MSKSTTAKKPAAKGKAKAAPKAATKTAAKPKAKAAAKPAAKAAAPKAKAGGKPSDAVAAHFGVTLPARYRTFLDSGELAKVNKLFTIGIPGLRGRRQLVFDAPKLRTVFKTNGVAIDSIIPLAALAGEGELLTLDVSQPACPVGVWDEGSFRSWLPSLDALLATLVAKDAESAQERLEAASKTALTFRRSDMRDKGVKVLDKAIGDLTAATAGPALEALAMALEARARDLETLGRTDAAIASYRAAIACGTKGGHFATANLAQHFLKTEQPAEAIAICEPLLASREPMATTPAFFTALYLAIARAQTGDARAAADFKTLAKRYGKDDGLREAAREAIEKRLPKKSPHLALFS